MRQGKNSRSTSEHVLLPGAMFHIERAVWDAALSAICVTSHPGRHKMIDEVRHSTISNSFITENGIHELEY
jgi:hypothetical protein